MSRHHCHGEGAECCCGSCRGEEECHTCHGEGHEGGEKGDFAARLLELADEAWMELLKEKIKKQIEAEGGAHLDALAKLVAQTNGLRWKHKMEAKQGCHEFKEKLGELFKKK